MSCLYIMKIEPVYYRHLLISSITIVYSMEEKLIMSESGIQGNITTIKKPSFSLASGM